MTLACSDIKTNKQAQVGIYILGHALVKYSLIFDSRINSLIPLEIKVVLVFGCLFVPFIALHLCLTFFQLGKKLLKRKERNGDIVDNRENTQRLSWISCQ